MPNASVPAAAEGMPDFRKVFEGLDDPIAIARQRADVATHLAGWMLEILQDEHGARTISKATADTLAFMVFDVQTALEKLEAHWIEINNAACAAERLAVSAEAGR